MFIPMIKDSVLLNANKEGRNCKLLKNDVCCGCVCMGHSQWDNIPTLIFMCTDSSHSFGGCNGVIKRAALLQAWEVI